MESLKTEPKFSQRIKEVISLSREEALRLGHDYIGTEHFILGMISEGNGMGLELIRKTGIKTIELKQRIESVIRSKGANYINNLSNLPLTRQSEKVLKISHLEAKIFHSTIIDTEHLLLAILRDTDNLGCQILNRFKLNYNLIKEILEIHLIGETNNIENVDTTEATWNEKILRLSQVARKLNVSINTITEHLAKEGIKISTNPNSKIRSYNLLLLQEMFNTNSLIGEVKVKYSEVVEENKLSLNHEVANRINKSLEDKSLTTLDLSYLELRRIPKELKNITHIKKIKLNGNNLTNIENIPDGVEEIDLSNNSISKIEELPNSILHLNLNSNKILQIGDLPISLRKLNVNDNQIERLVITKGLKTLSICNNAVKSISNKQKYFELTELYLFGNPVENLHPSTLGENEKTNCLSLVKNFFVELRRKKEINRNVKLVLIGNSNVGKSSILNALKDLPCDENIKSTHAIALDSFKYSHKDFPVHFSVWDLGGQEIYYGTHRIFMTSTAIQLLVYDEITECISVSPDRIVEGELVRHINLPFYLSRIRELSPDSEVIIVRNKIEVPSNPINYSDVFYNYRPFPISVFLSKGIETLKTEIWEKAKSLELYGMEVPFYWEKIRKIILEHNGENALSGKLITIELFTKLCLEEGVLEEGVKDLIVYLHNTGAIYYKKELGEYIILDIIWALNAIYKILDRESNFYKEMRSLSYGKCNVRTVFEDLDTTNQKYSIEEKWLFLNFMRSSGMCFPFKIKENEEDNLDTQFVFPEFLPRDKPDVVDLWEMKKGKKCIWVKKFNFLPYYPLHGFINSFGSKTPFNFIWRNGILILFERKDYTGFLIEADFDNNKLILTIDETVSEWFDAITDAIIVHGDNDEAEWELIHGSKIPIKEKKEVSDLDKLKDIEQKNIFEAIEKKRAGKLVISYAKEDLDQLKLIVEYLEAQGIDYWYDENLSNREDWTLEIEKEFKEAGGFLILLSHHYMLPKKKFIHENEVPIILDGFKEKKFATILKVGAFDLNEDAPISCINMYSKGEVMPDLMKDESQCKHYINRFVSDGIMKKF
ncbi:MAG: TIR domain-containing protein [Cytophagales bacterium]|nr:TIR domain-containing protein [Cytophagales bacterium]